MCGIVGIYSHEAVASELYDSLVHLQHRGQDAAGILTCDSHFHVKHGLGLVREIFTSSDTDILKGNMGIAHTRYPTAGGYSSADIQPLCTSHFALAHNGNLVNYSELADELRHHHDLSSSIDSEALLHLLSGYLAVAQADDEDGFFSQLCKAMQQVFNQVKGSYSVVSLALHKGLFAFRDPHGIRPLVMGERKRKDGGSDYIFASESTVFYALGYELKGDVQPGEVVFVNKAGKLFRQIIDAKAFKPCVFEYVYFARPDAILDEVSVYHSRLRLGQNLARQWKARYSDKIPDVVIPAPFTANTAALSFAHEIGVRYSEGLYKNPFIGRTFIMSNQKLRSQHVRYKLTPQKTEIENKKVLIVDDSIVRGTTSREIIKMVREFGAKEIYFVSSCPPIKHPCFYGIDIPSHQELIAALYPEDLIRDFLGVDLLLYQTQEDLIDAVTKCADPILNRPCMACIDGNYICESMTKDKLNALVQKRELEKSEGC